MAVQLNNINGTLLPPTITGPIFDQALETSAVMSLARKVPLSVTAATAIPVSLDVPTAGWVAEGGMKPVASGGVGIKTMTGKKVAVIVPVSKEVVMSNAAGLYDQLAADLPTALGRAFDYAAIHGKDLASGGAGPFTNYLRQYASTKELGTAAASAGGMWADLWGGVKTVTDNGYDFSGFAADPRLRPTIATSVDANGRPFFVDNLNDANKRDNGGSLLGYPVAFNRGVSGTYRRQNDKVWDITLVGTPTGGTWSVTFAGTAVTGLAYNISAATLQSTLRAALPAGTFSTVAVSGTAPYSITFPIGVGKPVVDQSTLTGGTAAASSATIARHTNPDTTVRAIGGDFSQCAYGVGMDITIDVSTQASYSPDGGTTWVSLWQNNLVGILAEAYFGFVVSDNEGAFISYLDAS
jgi:hypothetical protein